MHNMICMDAGIDQKILLSNWAGKIQNFVSINLTSYSLVIICSPGINKVM